MNPEGMKTLLLVCEDGEEEFDKDELAKKGVFLEMIDDPARLTPDRLAARAKRYKAERAFVELNGMWQLDDFYYAMPENWLIYQQTMFVEAPSIMGYNANMRQLVVDKIRDCEMVVLNRTPATIDKNEIHKIIRGISRRAAIVYDYPDGHVEYDEIEDPLPYDIDAPVIQISDEDYAIWYRDLSENMAAYQNKTVKFKGLVAHDDRLPANSLVIGRPVMTCCADDIQYAGLISVFKSATTLKDEEWVTVKGTIKIEKHKLYRSQGPVLYVENTEFAVPPNQIVATFY
jgi:hypothetical protein